MLVNILHDHTRTDRHTLFMLEAAEQGFAYKVWEAVKGGKPKENISAAHRKIIQHAKDNKYEEVCVMEDDCHWIAPGAFDYFISKKPNDFDLYLSSIEWGRIDGLNVVQDYAGNQCYVCHKKFYDTFLSVDPTKDIDRMMARKGKYVVCVPFATKQHETISDNTRRRVHSNAKLYFNRTFWNGTNGQ